MSDPKPQAVSPARTPKAIAKLEKQLVSYVAAASAAGVGMLALVKPADAEVVYTATNTGIYVNNGPVYLDLNNDHITDFSFSNQTISDSTFGIAFLRIMPKAGNAIWIEGVKEGKWPLADPLTRGVVVGPEGKFDGASAYLDAYQRSNRNDSVGTFGFWGKDKPLAGSYLGLKFVIAGETHYGWARLTVQAKGGNITATLTGYAYETVPNRPIITGMTHGAFDATDAEFEPTAAQSGTLGHLARGATGRGQ